MKISSYPDKEFTVMIIKVLSGPGEEQKNSDNLNKTSENIGE